MSRFALAGTAVLVVLLCCAQAAGAAKRVTVTGFVGRGGGKMRWYVTRYIKRNHSLVPLRKFTRTARSMGIPYRGRRNTRRVCKKAGIDAVVYGRVLRHRGRWWLRLSVKDGSTGRRVHKGLVPLRGPRLTASSRYSIRMALRKGLRKVEGVSSEEPEPRETTDPTPTPEDKTPKVKKKKPFKWAKRASYVSIIEGGPVLEVLGRKFSLKPKTTPVGDNPDYRTESVVPPFGFFVEGYPGAAFTSNMAGANIGLGFYWTRTFGVTSHSEGGAEKFKTVYQRFDFFLTFRWNILKKLKSPELRFDVALGNIRFLFGVPSSVDPLVRDRIKSLGVNFWYFMPRIRTYLPVVGGRVAVLFNLGIPIPFQQGPTTEWWAYGPGRAIGVDLAFGVDIRIAWKIYVLLMGRYSYFGVTYDESPQRTFEATKASDHYYGAITSIVVKY